MERPHFAGKMAGPRTIFYIDAIDAYSIEKFSHYQGKYSEYEVLFRPLARFRIKGTKKNIKDPKEKFYVTKSGTPDAIYLEQLPREPTEVY